MVKMKGLTFIVINFILILIIFIFSSCEKRSTDTALTFTMAFGDSKSDGGNSVIQTSDKGYLITGSTRSYGAGNLDVYMIKTYANGIEQWHKTFGDTSNDVGYSVQQTSDGGYIIAGYTYSFSAGNADVYLIKTDANGNQLWYKTFGDTSRDIGNSVQLTPDGGYIITGNTWSFGAGKSDVYLIKTDTNGNQQWYKTFGGLNLDYGESVQPTSDGGYIIAGFTNSYGAGKKDVFLIKTDTYGNQQWYKTFGGINDDYGFAVQQTSDTGYIIVGSTRSFGVSDSTDDVYLIKTNANGNQQWFKTFGGTRWEQGYSVQPTSDKGYIITGYTFSFGNCQVYLIKTDNNGNLKWYKIFKTYNKYYHSEGKSVQPTSDGGYIIAGNTNLNGFDVFLIKTDKNGDVE